MSELGKLLVFVGGLIVVLGLVFIVGGRIPFLGRLPGDFSFSRGNTHIYFPLATSVILSVILTLVLNLFFRGR
ncbi:MAG TPA: DUF2905 domain-containing protein [Candidatus Dormibacteraeota bacterium]